MSDGANGSMKVGGGSSARFRSCGSVAVLGGSSAFSLSPSDESPILSIDAGMKVLGVGLH